jgi:hypothetical protein
MWASTGTKLSWMKDETSSSAYDSASSRAQATQAGAALKSVSDKCWIAFYGNSVQDDFTNRLGWSGFSVAGS